MRSTLALRLLPLCLAAPILVIGCSSSPAVPPISLTCGDGHRDASEQCDDGNDAGLDGCSATCLFEQVQRMNSFSVQFTADSNCPDDAFGSAFGSFIHSGLQNAVDTAVQNGSFSLLMETLGASDLSGTNQGSVTIGFLSGTPRDLDGGTPYNGASDLDWWYAPGANQLGADNLPKTQLTGSIASHILTLGPATVEFDLGLGSPFTISGVQIRSTLGAATTPKISTNGAPPGHLASENLDPLLQSYASGGSANSPSTFCGNISAQSLQASALSSMVTQYCTDYTSANTLLDLFVGGCSIAVVGNAVNPTQPDQVDPSKPAAGAGGPYHLTTDSTSHAVNGCKDKNGASATLSNCLAAAAFSSYFKFTSDRVILH